MSLKPPDPRVCGWPGCNAAAHPTPTGYYCRDHAAECAPVKPCPICGMDYARCFCALAARAEWKPACPKHFAKLYAAAGQRPSAAAQRAADDNMVKAYRFMVGLSAGGTAAGSTAGEGAAAVLVDHVEAGDFPALDADLPRWQAYLAKCAWYSRREWRATPGAVELVRTVKAGSPRWNEVPGKESEAGVDLDGAIGAVRYATEDVEGCQRFLAALDAPSRAVLDKWRAVGFHGRGVNGLARVLAGWALPADLPLPGGLPARSGGGALQGQWSWGSARVHPLDRLVLAEERRNPQPRDPEEVKRAGLGLLHFRPRPARYYKLKRLNWRNFKTFDPAAMARWYYGVVPPAKWRGSRYPKCRI